MWWNICHSIVVIKYVMKYLSLNCCDKVCDEIWNEDLHLMKCLNNLLDRFSKIIWCDEDVLKNWFIELLKKCWRCVEDVLKMCWRCVEDVMKNCWRSISSLHQVCNVCMNFIRSFLKNNSMKMRSVILHIWIKLKRSDE